MSDYIVYNSSIIIYINGSVVQLDRILDFGSNGWGFESLRGHTVGKAFFRSAFPFLF